MKLTAFRVQNYKKIRDTGWVEVGDLTAFVGKNEAGKSAVFRGLSKFNPSDGEKYDGLKEFPRRRYTDEFSKQDWAVSSCRFTFNDEEKQRLVKLHSVFDNVESVIITRHYSSAYKYEWSPDMGLSPVEEQEVSALLQDIKKSVNTLTGPDGKGEALQAIKQSLTEQIENMEKSISADITSAFIEKIELAVQQSANEEWQRELLEKLVELPRPLQRRAEAIEAFREAEGIVKSMIPRFLYFDKYDVLDSAIYFPAFLDDSSPKKRVTLCLFQHVGLDVERVAKLGIHNQEQNINVIQFRRMLDERTIHFSSASNAMTEKFANWWEQRKHKFRYQADGYFFRIWVSDDLDPSEIELDQRSYGMQYFFSFYLVFLVEAEGAHKDCILLLDEPGLHLHGTAQAKLIHFFEKLSLTNQTMYSTHSPFLVDVNHFERVRAVYEDEDGTTRVTEDVLKTDDDTVFPLQSALGYDITQSLFVGPNCLLVEGPSDMIYLRCLSSILERKGKQGLSEKWTIVPVGGADKICAFSALLGSQKGLNVAVLVDIQPKDKPSIENLYKKKLLKKNRVMTFGDFLKRESADIEDMFDPSFYLDLVNGEYGTKIKETDLIDQQPRILKRIEQFLKNEGTPSIAFNHYRPARFLQESIDSIGKKITEDTLDRFQKVFEEMNALA